MKNYFIALFIFVFGFANSQKIAFEKESYNFGSFKEALGTQAYSFKFKNTGTKALTLTSVVPSCGCTTPNFSKAPIAPGKIGYVKVTFDPKNRPGPFEKSITIKSNADVPVVVLKISGKVIQRAKTLTDLYPQNIGDLSVKSTSFNFSSIKNTEIKTEELPVYNGTNKDLKIEFVGVPEYITLKVEPAVLKPQQKGKIIGIYNGIKVNDYGFKINRLKLKINGKIAGSNKLSVSAKIKEDFSKLTPQQIQNAPKASINSKVFNFGKIKHEEIKTYNFIFKNEGKSDLIIRKITTTCNCTVVNPESKVVKPGQSVLLKTKFNSTGKYGNQKKTITLITNDPNNSTIRLTVIGEVI
jgi:hypothetical protein